MNNCANYQSIARNVGYESRYLWHSARPSNADYYLEVRLESSNLATNSQTYCRILQNERQGLHNQLQRLDRVIGLLSSLNGRSTRSVAFVRVVDFRRQFVPRLRRLSGPAGRSGRVRKRRLYYVVLAQELASKSPTCQSSGGNDIPQMFCALARLIPQSRGCWGST